jgi:hypothetical protein
LRNPVQKNFTNASQETVKPRGQSFKRLDAGGITWQRLKIHKKLSFHPLLAPTPFA